MKSKYYKMISFVLILLIVSTLIGGNNSIIEATEITAVEPSYDVEFNDPSPNPAKIGEDIVVSGQIIPKPFKTDIPPKEIVLVLDTSGSMSDPINVNCEKYLQEYCTTHNVYGEHSSRCTNKKNEFCKECNKVVDSNHKSEMLYENHRLQWYWDYNQYWCLDCGKWIGTDGNYHLQYKPYKNHNTIDNFCNQHNKQGDHDVKHNWKKNYCAEHDRYGSHSYLSTRISELKKAATSFVDKMKDVENLKIAIITFNNSATIEADSFFSTKESEELKRVIDKIRPGGGTNTGEGLRKAAYLLNGEESQANAMKSIVLMSDGLPSVMTADPSYWNMRPDESWLFKTESRYYKPYLNIESKSGGQPTYFYWAAESVYVDYAKEIAKIIRDKKNVTGYSIGYGLDKNGNKNLRDIHKALIGETWGDESQDESKGFFASSNGSIESIFNKIADDILNSYNIIDVGLKLTFDNDFLLKNGDGKLSLSDIKYIKDDNLSNESLGKIVYTAEPLPFQFIIKATKEGEALNVFRDFKIEYNFNNQNKVTESYTTNVNITIDSGMPANIIGVLNEKNIEVIPGEDVTFSYNIEAKDFSYKDSQKAIANDVVILIDLSSKMGDDLSNIKTYVNSLLLNNGVLKGYGTQYSIVTFGNNVISSSPLTSDVTSLNREYLDKASIDNKITTSNLTNALREAKAILNSGRKDSKKNIILISEDKITYSQNDVNDMKNYNLIIANTRETSGEGTVNQLYNDVNGTNRESYFTLVSGMYQDLVNNVASRIVNTTNFKPYEFTPQIKINLGDNFISSVSNNGEVVVTLPEGKKIIYRDRGNGNYAADPIDPITITVKVKDGKQDELLFGLNNNQIIKSTLNYINVIGNSISKNVDTPVVKVRSQVTGLVHGLYNGIRNNVVDIQTNANGFEIATGSTVTFGSKFTLASNKAEFNLNIDSKFEQLKNDDIKIYKVVKNGENISLVELLDVIKTKTSPNNNFNIKLENLNGNNGSSALENEVVVVYKGKIKEDSKNEIFENIIQFTNASSKVSIFTPNSKDGELPDLF